MAGGTKEDSKRQGDHRSRSFNPPEGLARLIRIAAAQYGISYPTVRLRLDRLMQKVKLLDGAPDAGPFELRLRAAYADGLLNAETFHALLEAHRKEQEDRHETRAR